APALVPGQVCNEARGDQRLNVRQNGFFAHDLPRSDSVSAKAIII
ncbi:hypothetical protein Ga0466249_005470, partial [Sporomusaceae bacterium BoRhaA]|nr:hypothetical protein [Pelorhabdus rhamnosifermentans]